jgi:hypothetical protein
MSWADLPNNKTVSRANLQDAVNQGIFQLISPIPTANSTKQITCGEARSYVMLDDYYLPVVNSQLVIKQDLVPLYMVSCGTTAFRLNPDQVALMDLGSGSGSCNITVATATTSNTFGSLQVGYGADRNNADNILYFTNATENTNQVSGAFSYYYDSNKGGRIWIKNINNPKWPSSPLNVTIHCPSPVQHTTKIIVVHDAINVSSTITQHTYSLHVNHETINAPNGIAISFYYKVNGQSFQGSTFYIEHNQSTPANTYQFNTSLGAQVEFIVTSVTPASYGYQNYIIELQ